MGGSAESGKLVVPSIVLNGGLDVQFGFVEGLLASDGSIPPSRDWALIHTANRGFADSIGLLLAGLGLKYVTRRSRQSSQVLYSVGFRLRGLPERFWMNIGHQERTKRYVTRELNRAGKIPVLESGLLALCEKHSVTHSLPKGPHHFASAEDVLQRIRRIRKKEQQIAESDRKTIQQLENLAQSELTFLCVREIDEVPPKTEFVYCFEMEEELNGFVTQGNLFVSNSFGYQGYKNARFGRIECHEAINAYARDILVHTMEIAESHGYEVVHGIVDSVWLRPKPNADPIEKVREHIAGSIGLPIELEGRYKWIVFLPCTTTAAALKQMEKRGFPVEPGESVRYVLMDARARDSERKVRVAEFLQGDEAPDAWEYIKLLCRSGQTLLAPFGYTEDKLFAMCEDLSDLSITNMPERAIAIQEDYKSAGEGRSKARGGVGYKKPWRVIDEASTEEAPAEF